MSHPLDVRFEPLGKHTNREAFSCGVGALDLYFHKQALQDMRKRVAATFVLLVGEMIAGFYTLSSTAIPLEDLPEATAKKPPKYKYAPATLLGRLAVDERHREKKFGDVLLMDALQRSLKQSFEVGAMAVVVDGKDETARSFYLHYGFLPFPNIPSRLFLPMETIEKLLGSPCFFSGAAGPSRLPSKK